jgi:hypothetical protein
MVLLILHGKNINIANKEETPYNITKKINKRGEEYDSSKFFSSIQDRILRINPYATSDFKTYL